MTDHERTPEAAMKVVREQAADMIESMAEAHYARDIRGGLALRDWHAIAQTLRVSFTKLFDPNAFE